jgi:hypothetical protein
MSPEQARGSKDINHLTDIYAMGVILYESVTGRCPFAGDNYLALVHNVVHADPTPPTVLRSDVTPELEQVILFAMAKDPGGRFRTAADMIRQLLPFVDDGAKGYQSEGFWCVSIATDGDADSDGDVDGDGDADGDADEDSDAENPCERGYHWVDDECADIDECLEDIHECHPDLGICHNVEGTYYCTCLDGYEGDGRFCIDIDECTAGTDDCHDYATCTNTDGSFLCTCNEGFSGDGRTCTCGSTIYGTACVDTSTNVSHCGGCFNRCDLPNAVEACDGGTCVVDSCERGFWDCTPDPEDGCESEAACAVMVPTGFNASFGGPGFDIARDVAMSGTTGVYVTGAFENLVDFGGGALSASGTDAFVASYTSTGAYRWAKAFTGTGGASAQGVAVGSGVYVTGYSTGANDYGGGSKTSTGDDVFLVSLDPATGAHTWSKLFTATGNDRGLSVAVGRGGSVFLTGYFDSLINFGGGDLTTTATHDVFVACFSSAGAHTWSVKGGTSSEAEGAAITFVAGEVNTPIVTGYFVGNLDFGTPLSGPAGDNNIFYARFNGSTGAHIESYSATSTDDEGNGIATDHASYCLTGLFESGLDFPGDEWLPLISHGSNDIFLHCMTGFEIGP